MNKLPFEDESPAQQRDLLLSLPCWFHEGWAWKILPCVHVQRLRKARGCLTHGNFLKRPKIRSCRCKRRWRTALAISLKSPAVMLQLIDCNVDLELFGRVQFHWWHRADFFWSAEGSCERRTAASEEQVPGVVAGLPEVCDFEHFQSFQYSKRMRMVPSKVLSRSLTLGYL